MMFEGDLIMVKAPVSAEKPVQDSLPYAWERRSHGYDLLGRPAGVSVGWQQEPAWKHAICVTQKISSLYQHVLQKSQLHRCCLP